MVTKIPGLKGVTLRKIGKYVFNRLRGVKYGAVRTNDGIDLRTTKELKQFAQKMSEEGYPTEAVSKRITLSQAKNYVQQAGTDVQPTTRTNFFFNQFHGTSQILDGKGGNPVISIVEQLDHPTHTFLKITLYNALKNM